VLLNKLMLLNGLALLNKPALLNRPTLLLKNLNTLKVTHRDSSVDFYID
jgi:hypothetical protein